MAVDRLKRNDWIVATDGGRALILRNDGTVREPKLTLLRKHDQYVPPTRDLGTDKPGRTHASVGPGRSAMEPTDFHQQAEDRLMAEVAANLAEDLRRREFSTLVVAAAPASLGALRKAMSPELRKAIIAEVPKNFTGMELPQLATALSRALEAA
ncbi:baeRF12 domain-containing protein [Taklimakanibacter lacteus]|uniref:baeRF12 domain-containing protein n=1 Tax=Taklimakanibacter lacteus TaxID=2268456 RepID=UPI000E674692